MFVADIFGQKVIKVSVKKNVAKSNMYCYKLESIYQVNPHCNPITEQKNLSTSYHKASIN